MEEETTGKIEAYLDGEPADLPYATGAGIGRTVDYVIGRNRYIGYLISLATRSYRNMRIGLDCANGSAWMIARSVFEALCAKTYVIHAEPDGININEKCGSTHIGELQEFVIKNQLDAGFAFDGDADRCIAVDDQGNVVNGDLILYVCAVYMKENGMLENNTVATTIVSNLGLYKAFEAAVIDFVKTQVGDKYVYESMAKNDYCIGGEQTGHVIFSRYAATGDGILTALKIMEVILEKKMPLSKLISPVTIYPQEQQNIRVRNKTDVKRDPDILELIRSVEEELGDTGRILVRESGTEPVIRVMVEAKTQEICRRYVEQVVAKIREKGYCAQ